MRSYYASLQQMLTYWRDPGTERQYQKRVIRSSMQRFHHQTKTASGTWEDSYIPYYSTQMRRQKQPLVMSRESIKHHTLAGAASPLK